MLLYICNNNQLSAIYWRNFRQILYKVSSIDGADIIPLKVYCVKNLKEVKCYCFFKIYLPLHKNSKTYEQYCSSFQLLKEKCKIFHSFIEINKKKFYLWYNLPIKS